MTGRPRSSDGGHGVPCRPERVADVGGARIHVGRIRGARLAEIGTILGGRYRLVELLGRAAWPRSTGRSIPSSDATSPSSCCAPSTCAIPTSPARFRQEAQNAASLNHPNVVSVYDYGEDPNGPVHRHGAHRRRGPRDDPAPEWAAAAAQAARIARGGGSGARRRARPRDRPSRREAGQRPHRSGRAGQGRRLRHRARRRRGADDAARHDARARSTTSARSRRAASPRRTSPTSTRSASSCSRCSPAFAPGRATAPPASRSPA